MRWWILGIAVLALLALAPTASEQYGAASWRILKSLLTSLDCSGGNCDLAAGTTIGGSPIGSGGGVSDGDKGDVVVSGSGATWLADDNAVVTGWQLGTLGGPIDLDYFDVLHVGDMSNYGDFDFFPYVDYTAATGFDRVKRQNFKNWFAGDGDMNPSTKTGVEGLSIEHVILSEQESGSIMVRGYSGADADMINLWMDLFCTQGSRVSGNEGCDGIRNAIRDYWLNATGTTSANLTAGAGSQTIAVGGITEAESKMLGEGAYAVFTGSAVSVDVVDAPPGTINSSGTLEDPGTAWSFDGSASGQGVVTLGAGQVTSSGVKADSWCAASVAADYVDVNSQPAQLWLPIEAINAGADTITLGWVGQGYDAHTPYPMLMDEGTGSQEMILAPCAVLGRPTIPDGTYVATQLEFTKGANFPAISSGATFEVNAYPNTQLVGMRILMSNQLGTLYPDNGIQAINRLEGSATSGRFQLGSAFRPMFAGSLSNLADGTDHAFRAGMDCWFKPGSCQFGIDYWAVSDPAPVDITQSAVRASFDGADWDDDVARDVVCIYRNTVKQSCITIDKTDGFGDDGTPFALTTGSKTTNNCAKWDASGRVVDAGAPCGGSGGNSVEVELDFSTGAEIASVVVTGQTWVASGSEIVCSPTMTATADRAEAAEDAVIEGIVVSAHSRVAGTGFTLTGAPRFGNAYGKFKVHCIGV